MKYWKHDSDLMNSTIIHMILDKHGFKGVYAFFKLFEMLAKDLNVDHPASFLFNTRQLLSNLFPRSCRRTGKNILNYFQELRIIKYQIKNKETVIICNEMKKLADEYTQKVLGKKK